MIKRRVLARVAVEVSRLGSPSLPPFFAQVSPDRTNIFLSCRCIHSIFAQINKCLSLAKYVEFKRHLIELV